MCASFCISNTQYLVVCLFCAVNIGQCVQIQGERFTRRQPLMITADTCSIDIQRKAQT